MKNKHTTLFISNALDKLFVLLTKPIFMLLVVSVTPWFVIAIVAWLFSPMHTINGTNHKKHLCEPYCHDTISIVQQHYEREPMITTTKTPYKDGDLRIGWASWDDGSMTDRSIKYAYKDVSGKISRGAPELPLDILIDMVVYAYSENELRFESARCDQLNIDTATKQELLEEKKLLASSLMILSKMNMVLPWAEFKDPYDQIGTRYEKIKAKLATQPSL